MTNKIACSECRKNLAEIIVRGDTFLCSDCAAKRGYLVAVEITAHKFASIRRHVAKEAEQAIPGWKFGHMLGMKSGSKRSLDAQVSALETNARRITKKISANALSLEQASKDELLALIKRAEKAFSK